MGVEKSGLGSTYDAMLREAMLLFRGFGKKTVPVPEEVIDFRMCEHFHITPRQLEEQFTAYERRAFADLMILSNSAK